MIPRCTEPACNGHRYARGLCASHYNAAQRRGDHLLHERPCHTRTEPAPWHRDPSPLDRQPAPYCPLCGGRGRHWAGCDHAPAANVCAVESQGQQKRNAPPVLGSSGRASLGEVPHA